MSPSLRVVEPRSRNTAPPTANLAEQVRRLQADAKGLARQHIEGLRTSLLQTGEIAAEIAQGGEAYPPGVRDIASRLSEDSVAKAQTLAALLGRV